MGIKMKILIVLIAVIFLSSCATPECCSQFGEHKQYMKGKSSYNTGDSRFKDWWIRQGNPQGKSLTKLDRK